MGTNVLLIDVGGIPLGGRARGGRRGGHATASVVVVGDFYERWN
jgi:hypothetical protein